MESELRSLIGKYGVRAVHEGLMKEMKETFRYLQTLFDMKNDVVVEDITKIEIVNDTIPDTIHQEAAFLGDTDSLDEAIEEAPKDPNVKEILIGKQKPAILSPPDIDVKHQKAKHREEVEKKKQELLAKGVKPETLLTEVNLRKWLGDGMSYLKIAKETGVHEVQVANAAKSFGLQSNISKYVAIKRAK